MLLPHVPSVQWVPTTHTRVVSTVPPALQELIRVARDRPLVRIAKQERMLLLAKVVVLSVLQDAIR